MCDRWCLVSVMHEAYPARTVVIFSGSSAVLLGVAIIYRINGRGYRRRRLAAPGTATGNSINNCIVFFLELLGSGRCSRQT